MSHLSALKRELLFVFNFFILTKPVVQDEEDKDDLKSSRSNITKRSRRGSELKNTKISTRSLNDSNVESRNEKSESLINFH